MFIPDKADKQNLPPYKHKVCAPIWNILHGVSTLLNCGLRETTSTEHTQSVSCFSSSLESSGKGIVRSVSESDGVSDRVGSWQTLLFRLFEGPRRTFDVSWLVLDLLACLIWFFWVAPASLPWAELVIFFAVPPRVFGCRFRLRTGLISDAQKASAEVNNEKLTELNDGWSLVFTKAGWFTGAASVSSEAKREIVWSEDVLVTRKEACHLAAISCYLACCISLVCSAKLFTDLVDGDDSPAVGLNRAILQLLSSRMFSWAPWKLYPSIALCDCCEVGDKWC